MICGFPISPVYRLIHTCISWQLLLLVLLLLLLTGNTRRHALLLLPSLSSWCEPDNAPSRSRSSRDGSARRISWEPGAFEVLRGYLWLASTSAPHRTASHRIASDGYIHLSPASRRAWFLPPTSLTSTTCWCSTLAFTVIIIGTRPSPFINWLRAIVTDLRITDRLPL